MQFAQQGRPTAIYVLIDPRNDEVRYVGKTIQPLAVRLAAHIRRSKQCKTHRDCWIASLQAAGLSPQIEKIDSVTGDWAESEVRWIAHYKGIGARLTNQTIGGEGLDPAAAASSWTQERRATQAARTAEMNRSRKGTPWTEARKVEQSAVRKRSWESSERRERMSRAMAVVTSDPDYRRRMSAAVARSWTPERRARQAEVAARVNQSRWAPKS